MHTTDDGRLALTCMMGLLATLALARMGEARFRARPPVTRAAPAEAPSVREGNALRDGRRIDVNAASVDELALLPGVGPKLARRIVDVRARVGPFAELAALRRVPGLGSKTLAKLAPWVRMGAPSEHLEQAAEP